MRYFMRRACDSERRHSPPQSSRRHRKLEPFTLVGSIPATGDLVPMRMRIGFFSLSSGYLVQDIEATVQALDGGHPGTSKGRAHAELSNNTLCSTSTTFITS